MFEREDERERERERVRDERERESVRDVRKSLAHQEVGEQRYGRFPRRRLVGSSPVGNHGTSPTVGLTNLVQAGLGGAGVHPVDAQVVRDHAPGTVHLESASRVLQRVDSIRRLNYDYRTLQSRTVWSFLQLLGSYSRYIGVKQGHSRLFYFQ